MEIKDALGNVIYQRKTIDPVHLPDIVLEPGSYSWNVHALSGKQDSSVSRGLQAFTITENCAQLPWIQAKELLEIWWLG